jgi:hypothetical protein
MPIDHLAVGVATAMGHPSSVAGTQHWFQGGDHAACRNDGLHRLALTNMAVRLPVGDDEKLTVA